MTAFQVYIALLSTILACSGLVIAFYSGKSYNVLVKLGATNTPAPTRELRPTRKGPIEISVKFNEINGLREAWIDAGYSVKSWKRDGDNMKLYMTKKANAR